MSKYRKNDIIGAKSFNPVYNYFDIETETIVAMKIFMLRPDLARAAYPSSELPGGEIGVPSMAIREISLLREMEHENVARLHDIVCRDGDNLVRLYFEYPGKNLKKFVYEDQTRSSDPKIVKKLLYQLLRGVSYYHSIKAAHGNLNLNNVLIDCSNDNEILKIINIPVDVRPCYTAPEILFGATELTPAADMFSIGCIFAEMVAKKPLFSPVDMSEINCIFSFLGTPTEQDWPGVTDLYQSLSRHQNFQSKNLVEEFPGLEDAGVDLLMKLLCLNPSNRITAADALKHAYFAEVTRSSSVSSAN